MASPRLVPLKCPRCGSELPACENDVLFACPPCTAAWELGPEGLEPVPLAFAAPSQAAKRSPSLFLPVWRYAITLNLSSANPAHRHALEQAMSMKWLYVSAFTIHGLVAFGDPGLVFSQARTEALPGGGGLPLVGGDRGRRDARRWIPLTVLSILSRRMDVSEVRMNLRHGEETLLGVPFYAEGQLWRDGLLGQTYPRSAVLDAARIEAVWAKHPPRGSA